MSLNITEVMNMAQIRVTDLTFAYEGSADHASCRARCQVSGKSGNGDRKNTVNRHILLSVDNSLKLLC